MLTPQTMEQTILSTPKSAVAPAIAFDVCQVSTVLRTVLFVHGIAGVGLLYVSAGLTDWALRLELLTAGALPATLLWLVMACALKRLIARLPRGGQYLCGAALGAVSGTVACAILDLFSPQGIPWLAGIVSGAALALCIVISLVWRVRGRTPAGTTARLAELQSRIRPHFLFNTLNSAIALIRADPAKAETILEDLSDLFHNALSDRGEPSTVGQEITLASRYLEIEQVRFGERLQVQWSLDQRANSAVLPPLILQPLVENAVKHGVEPSPTGAQMRVSTRVRGKMAIITVSNTTPAGQGPHGHGIALRNVRERLRLQHDLHCEFLCQRKGDLFEARIEVPLPN